jgi:hypothetical protein
VAANTTPIFTLTPHIGQTTISTANTNRDGTGTLGTLVTAATNGTRVDRIVVEATSTTAAGVVTFFVYDGSSVSTLWQEVLVTAITPSATVVAFRAVTSRTRSRRSSCCRRTTSSGPARRSRNPSR